MRPAIILLITVAITGHSFGFDFPLELGYKWEYKTHSPQGSSITVRVITMVENEEGTAVYTLMTSGKYSPTLEKIKIEDNWLFSNLSAGEEFFPVLPLDPYPGDSWTFTITKSGVKEKRSYYVQGEESITVSLGTFNALKVKITIETGEDSEEEDAYYVDGIGLMQYTGDNFREELIKYNFEK